MAHRRRNILLITSDQMHWDTLGATNGHIRTPALDRLTREGTRFNRAYCPNPVCTPSRVSIITGQYPAWHGAWTIGVKLSEDVPTVGDALRDGGYGTALIGKAHFQPLASTPEQTSLEAQPTLRDLDFWRGFGGPWYGFDTVELARNHADESHVGQHYALWMEERGLTNWRDHFRSWPPDPDAPRREHAWDLPPEYHYTTWTAERTVAAIERHAADDRPFSSGPAFRTRTRPTSSRSRGPRCTTPPTWCRGRSRRGNWTRCRPTSPKCRRRGPISRRGARRRSPPTASRAIA